MLKISSNGDHQEEKKFKVNENYSDYVKIAKTGGHAGEDSFGYFYHKIHPGPLGLVLRGTDHACVTPLLRSVNLFIAYIPMLKME